MKTRTVDNRNRAAQPEPGEDPALEKAPVRAGAQTVLSKLASKKK